MSRLIHCVRYGADQEGLVRIPYPGELGQRIFDQVSQRAWGDEAHVEANRALYQEKFRIADEVFKGVQRYQPPEGGFFLWLPVDDGETAALKLWRETGVRVLPGAYLGREVDGDNPGRGYIRVALVAPKEEMQRGLKKLRDCLYA